jgi:hypothetical protein
MLRPTPKWRTTQAVETRRKRPLRGHAVRHVNVGDISAPSMPPAGAAEQDPALKSFL